MFFYEGYSCPVCGKVFAEKDDVVVCPTCGAPHHRECWKQEGHCHYVDTHGTPQQWSREKDNTVHQPEDKQQGEQRACPHCGHKNSVFAEFCSRCGKTLQATEWNSDAQASSQQQQPFSTFGGYSEYRPFQAPVPPDVSVPDDTDIDGVSAKEMRLFVGQNSNYYVPRFHKMHEKNSCFSWNWAAFLLTPYWLWYRKQYLPGIIVLLFEAVNSIVSGFFLYSYIGFSTVTTNAELSARLEELSAGSTFMLWMAVMYLLLFISILIRIFFGTVGNYLYYRSAKKRVLKLRGQANNAAMVAAGGVSTVFAVVAYVVLYLVSTLSNFIFL